MAKKITVQQLYSIARKQEVAEYNEAVKTLAHVCGCYKYDEDNETEIDCHRPVVAAHPKHYEGVADFKVVGIDDCGYLDLKDEWSNVLEREVEDVVEYGHLQYVTDFVWYLVEHSLINNLKSKMVETGKDTVAFSQYVEVSWYDFLLCHISGEVLMRAVRYNKEDDTLVLELDEESSSGKPQMTIDHIEQNMRIKILQSLLALFQEQ